MLYLNRKTLIQLGLSLLSITSLVEGQTFNPFVSNGTGCVATSNPSYCSQAFTVLSTDPANTNAITQVVEPAPTNYSTIDAHTLAPVTNTLIHWQPWWGCSGHPNIGYNESNASVVTAHLARMKLMGIDGVVVDYYGNNSAKSCNLTATNNLSSIINGNPTLYPKLILGMDQGSWNNSGQCPNGSGVNDAQMETCIEDQFDYAAQNFLYKSYYMTSGGKPLVTLFLDETNWPSVNFDNVWPHVHAHVAQGQSCGASCTYTAQVLLIGRNSGSITRTGLDGGFAWSPATTYINSSPNSQLLWNGAAGYLDNFYTICRNNSTKKCIGLFEGGFDDSNASFGTGKMISQLAGTVLILSANKIAALGYTSGAPLEFSQFETWNDMEEGTGLENGLDNKFSIAISKVGSNVNWTITKLDSTYSDPMTIDHLQLIACVSTSCQVATDSIAYGATGSTSILTVPNGTWDVYMRIVGKTFMFNQVSNGVAYSVNTNSGIGVNGTITIKGGVVVK